MTKKTKKQGPSVVVKRAGAGLGLFAGEDIKKGAFVIEYTGELISAEEADRRGGKYLMEISSRRTIDGKGRANTARYINHGCKPNCEAVVKGSRVEIEAIRSIAAGEELAYDYGKYYFDTYIRPFGCKCGAKVHKYKKKKNVKRI
jgi:uncharacterized protein